MDSLDSNITNFPLGLKSFLNHSQVHLTILLLRLRWSCFAGRCWRVQTSDVFRSDVKYYGVLVWLWTGTDGTSFLSYCVLCVCNFILTQFSTCRYIHAHRRVLCLPLTSWAPASVKSMLITSSKLQPGSDTWLSWPTWCNILFRTSSREAAVSSSRILALARKPSRSRCARISSSKFISFTYCEKDFILSTSEIVLLDMSMLIMPTSVLLKTQGMILILYGCLVVSLV